MTSAFATTLDELSATLGSRARALRALRSLWERPAPPIVVERRLGGDGTTKYLLDLGGTSVETVRIPGRGRSTVCVSSQAGCTRACTFCATKELGFGRNLTADEIVAQYAVARGEAPPDQPARNVVFMGMGEPMDNLDAVLRTVAVLTQTPAPQLRAQSVTVSTSGVLPGMRRFLAESPASLALSLNATTDDVRARLMPQTRTWPIAALLGCLRDDAARARRRVYFVEYVLFDGVNDADADADRLVALLDGIPARVNLIPHNPYPGGTLRPPAEERVLAFHRHVADRGVVCLVRRPRGRDIAAACGQLALESC
jgi:23S rRNA (adenine2503-C2)-methyltransferase